MDIIALMDDYAERNERRFFWLSAAVLALTAVAFIAWALIVDYDGEAVRCNLPYANAIFDGVAPYTPCGDLKWEYPPFAYLLLLPPRIFTSDPSMYMALYAVEALAFAVIGLKLLMKMASRTNVSMSLIVVTYILSIALLHRFIYDRFDIIVAVVALAAVYFFLTNRYFAASAFLVLGIFMKIYPAVLAPVIALCLVNRRQYRDLAVQAAFCIILCGALMAPFLLMAPDNAWNFVFYHEDRGLHVESVAGSFLLLGDVLGLCDTDVSSTFGSWNINGVTSDMLTTASMAIMAAGVIFSLALYFVKDRRCPDQEKEALFMLACAAVLTSFVILNKVFSAQYVIWLLMAYLPLAMCLSPEGSRRLCAATLVLIALTMVMVFFYNDLWDAGPTGVVALVVRNIVLLAMLVLLWKRMLKADVATPSGS